MDGEQDATQTEGRQQEQQGDTPQPQENQDAQAHQPETVGANDVLLHLEVDHPVTDI